MPGAQVAFDAMSDRTPSQLGPNSWLVDEMYEQFLADPAAVSESWQEFFADYQRGPIASPAAVATPAADVGTTPIEEEPPGEEEPPHLPRPTHPTGVQPRWRWTDGTDYVGYPTDYTAYVTTGGLTTRKGLALRARATRQLARAAHL